MPLLCHCVEYDSQLFFSKLEPYFSRHAPQYHQPLLALLSALAAQPGPNPLPSLSSCLFFLMQFYHVFLNSFLLYVYIRCMDL